MLKAFPFFATLKFGFLISTLVVLVLFPASLSAADYVIENGVLVLKGPNTFEGTGSDGTLPETKATNPRVVSANVRGGWSALKKIGATFLSHDEVDRQQKARQAAKELVEKELAKHPGKVVVVPIMADRPPKAINELLGIEMTQLEHRNHGIGVPGIYPSKSEALDDILGSDQPEIKLEGQGQPPSGLTFFSGAMIGRQRSDGTMEVRPLNSADAMEHQKAQLEKQVAIEKEREATAKAKSAEAAKREAEALADEQKAKATKDRQAAELASKAAKERREALERGKKEIEARQEAQKNACKDGTTSECIKKNAEMSDFIEKTEEVHNLALCRAPDSYEPGYEPKSGPCAKDAPSCIKCNRAASILRQETEDRVTGNILYAAQKLKSQGQLNKVNFGKAIINLGLGNDVLKKFEEP
jgi:hypothetical protein